MTGDRAADPARSHRNRSRTRRPTASESWKSARALAKPVTFGARPC